MGPYCNFCGRRCFCHFPNETPKHILDAYGTASIIATCRAGQEFEKSKIGYCYDDIMEQIRAAESTQADVGWDGTTHYEQTQYVYDEFLDE
jgi:hypothetical protein